MNIKMMILWGEIINDILPKDYIKINFEQDLNVENRRILNIHGYGEKYLEVLKNLTNI